MKRHGYPENYIPRYDAFYNPETYEWIDPVCGNPGCELCSGRPPNAKGMVNDNDNDSTNKD